MLFTIFLSLFSHGDFTKTSTYRGFTANYFRLESVRVSVKKNRTLVGLRLYKDKTTHDANVEDVLTHATCVLPNARFLSRSALIDRVIAVCPQLRERLRNESH